MISESHELSNLLLPEVEAELGKTRRALERVPEIVKEQASGPLLAQFEELAEKSISQLRETSDTAFTEPWQAVQQGKARFSGTRYMAYRNIAINQMIHHRAQLGSYLRLLNLPVPSTFGPSADEAPI